MPRTLCIGNQTSDTDSRTTDLAKFNNSSNLGLVSSVDYSITGDGFWHTSLADVEYTSMLELAQKFDCVFFLDQQDINAQAYKLFQELQPLVSVVCERDDMFDHLSSNQTYWHKQFATNPSICVVPFVATSPDICSAIDVPVSAQEQETMKHNMIASIKNSQCKSCFGQEGSPQGFQPRKPKAGDLNSLRVNESLEWINALELQDINDLLELSTAYYYRIKSQELDSVDIKKLANPHIRVDIVDDCTDKLLYFLKRCVQAEITQFKLAFSSNDSILNKQLLDILNNFTSVTVEIILDAAGKANNVLATVENLKHRGHKVNVVSKVSMYNIDTLDELLELSDKISISTGIESPYNFPNKKQILEVLDRCKQTKKYETCVSIKQAIDDLYRNFYVYHYQKYTRIVS